MLLVSAVISAWGSLGLLHRMVTLPTVLLLMNRAAAFLYVQLIASFQQRVDHAMMGRVMSVLISWLSA